MYKNQKTAVIIAAAGSGRRMGTSIPKQFLKIGGEPVIVKTIKTFAYMDEIDHVFIVTSEEYADHCKGLVDEYSLDKVEGIFIGGKERQDSVFNALQEMNIKKPGISLVLIHDAARPYISRDVILNVLDAADEYDAAVACVPMKDSLRQVSEGDSHSVDRSEFYQVQTPQGFRKHLLIDAYVKAYDDGYMGTDDASVVERAGHSVKIVEGDYKNIKITTKEDLPGEQRVGMGYDVHKLVEGRKLILGGVEIYHSKGLLGHSDADVAVHALMDALLGAAGLGDIGRQFPDSDDAYKGISSMVLLQRVKDMLDEDFFKVGNADVTIIAQAPKISPYVDEMRENIAKILKVDNSQVNIKGTTTEGLGFAGKGEGIAAQAVVSLYR